MISDEKHYPGGVPRPRSIHQEDPFLKQQREELVQIVDENNKPVRGAPRFEMRRDVLWHRASYVYIITNEAHGHKFLV